MKKIIFIAVALVVTMVAMDASSAGIFNPGEFGEVKIDRSLPDITIFKEDPGMNYYYSGPEHAAMVVIGIRKEYRQVNDNWKPVSGQNLQAVVYDMRNYQTGNVLQTLSLETKNGTHVGVWYGQLALYQAGPILFTVNGQEVSMYTPTWSYFDSSMIGGGE